MAVFDLSGIGRAPARLDFKKLENTCGHHIAMMPTMPRCCMNCRLLSGRRWPPALTDETQRDRMLRAMPSLKERAKTFPELIEKAHFA
jgi:glutamyl-tRNA synthetase